MTDGTGPVEDHGSAAPPDPSAGPPARSSGHRRVVQGVVLLGLGLLVGVLVTLLLQPHRTTLVAPSPTGGRTPSAAPPSAFAPAVVAGTAVPIAPHVPPVEVSVPAIGVRSSLVGLRLNPDGSLQVPTEYAQAGWYSQGPAPGDTGQPAVIVGHVDSTNGPAVFFRLKELKNGDKVLVRRGDGTSVTFAVFRAAQYPKDAFPAQQVYAPSVDAELRLITCTGDFDRATGHYLGNYVIYARQVKA